MAEMKKDDKASITITILPAIIAALVGIISSILSYKAGIATIQIPLNATQTAEARQIIATNTPVSNVTSVDVPIAISSQKGWQSTEIYLNIGDKIEISVVDGKWTPYRRLLPSDEQALLTEAFRNLETFVNGMYETNGKGGSTCNKLNIDGCPITDGNWGALIARIGINSPFVVGERVTLTVSDSDVLQLRMNEVDSALDNNFGVLAVIIKVGRP